MTGRRRRTGGALACAAVALGAVVAPSVVFGRTAADSGAGGTADLDLVLVGAAVGVAYAAFLHRRLRGAASGREREADVWLSAVHGLVVLLLAASALPAGVLHVTARLHARAAEAEWPVLLAWAVSLGGAVLLAEGVRRLSLRWLSADRDRLPASDT